MQVLEKIKILAKDKINPKFQVLILKTQFAKNTYNGRILGRTLSDWVAFACSGLNINVIDWDGKTNILTYAKDYIDKNYDYTFILTSTIPLITKSTIDSIIEYVSIKNSNLCKLPVGYVVKNKDVLNKLEPQVDSLYSQNLEDFFVVETKKQFVQAEEVLQDRINTFHMNNGVDIRKPKSVYIEPEVDIADGVTIFAGNSLKGETIISKGVILKENNIIENTKIHSNSCIISSVITNSIISSNVYVSSFCDINNSLIGAESIIESGCKISNYRIDLNSKIKANTILGDKDDSDSGSRKSGK